MRSFANPLKSEEQAGRFAAPTSCDSDRGQPGTADPDIHNGDDADLRVMYHGNRFVAASELTQAFVATEPGVRVAYTAIPPVNTVKALESSGWDAGAAGTFAPDVVLGPAWLANIKPKDADEPAVRQVGLYSRLHGMVLMARADDARVDHADWRDAVRDKRLRVSLAGNQPRSHAIVHTYALALGEDGLDAMRQDPRVGVSSVRHHRAVPARIAAGCEDVGLQFLQSQPYWERMLPGRYRFLPVAGVGPEQLAAEDSYVYIVQGSKAQALAMRFARFMMSDQAQAILAKYHLQRQP
jgi:hypothetical protein